MLWINFQLWCQFSSAILYVRKSPFVLFSWAAHTSDRFSALGLGPIFERHLGCVKTYVSDHFRGYSTHFVSIFNYCANFRALSYLCENVRLGCFRVL
jgi:hypothetical protein